RRRRRGRGRGSRASSRPPQDRDLQALADALHEGVHPAEVEDVEGEGGEVGRYLDRGRSRRQGDAVGKDEGLELLQVRDRVADEAWLDALPLLGENDLRQIEVREGELPEKMDHEEKQAPRAQGE